MKFLTLLVALVLLATNAKSQLLGSPQIRRELGLSHQTSVLILRDLNEFARLNQGGVMSAKEARALQAERAKSPSPAEFSRRAHNRLTSAQKNRLEQIELQRSDPFVLQNWPVARHVGLTRAQHDELNRVVNEAFKSRVRSEQALFRRDQSWWMKADRKKYAARYGAHEREQTQISARYANAVKSAVARILTPTQKAKWVQIKGKPFRARITYDTKIYPMD